MSILWATRGLHWGFRFLLDGDSNSPLATYRQAFGRSHARRELCDVYEAYTAVRFEDPMGRTDDAGRIIPHDFVLEGDMAKGVTSVGAALEIIWPLVAQRYAAIWDQDDPRGLN